MNAPGSVPASPQSAMRRPKEEPVLPPLDPSAPQKIGTLFSPTLLYYVLIINELAILSVFDKTGLLDLAKSLTRRNVKLYGSGGTAAMVREAGFPIR
jgi:hypothetical protein